MINHNELKIGDIVYFVDRARYTYEYVVNVGVVDDIFVDGVILCRLCTKECRLVNGIKYDDFVTPTRWMKLPKGWTYNTPLYNLTYEDDNNYEAFLKIYSIKNKEDILEALDLGYLIRADKKDYSYIDVEIDKQLGYRLIRRYCAKEVINTGTTRMCNQIYSSYKEAEKWIDDYVEELKRQSKLTYKEWSLEQIQRTVDRYLNFTFSDESVRAEKRDKLMEYFKELKNVEDIETRLFDGQIEWKYWKNKKWNSISNNIV